uniref:Transmembrane protein 254 n=1 Tax=Haemonchus contortus TaxID=6289 RepID=A0A7I4XRN0_HAECO|nr:transmembrane protein C10orf57 homolog isoform [Haemonchus contortus]
MADYFRSPAFYWYLIILPALGINFLAFYSPKLLREYVPLIGPMAAYIGTHYHWITVYTNVFALVAHVGESLYALYLCTKLKFSLSCSAKWVVQTFLVGFASLGILSDFASKTKRRR